MALPATLNVGQSENDGTGDRRRDAFVKIKANFANLDGRLSLVETAQASLGTAAFRAVGTTAGTVAAGDDSRIVGAVQQTALSSALDAAFSNVRGSVLYRGASGWATLPPGTAGYVLQTKGSSADPAWGAQSISSAALDTAFGSTQGSILYRNASAWTTLTPGTSGQVLTTGGAGANPAWASAASGVPVRQTVLSGPAASGAPSFLPATAGSLTLTFQNITPSSPLVLTAAKGFGSGGAIDALAAFTANPSITLPASSTAWVYYDLDAAAWGYVTIPPIYQFGGTISTASFQFTFDTQSMKGWYGNGSVANRVNWVFIGEATTNASAVTSTVAYAYQGRYQSAPVAYAASTKYPFSHNLGVPVEQIDFTPYAATGSTGPWLPNALAYGSFPFPLLGLYGATSRLAIQAYTGSNGVLIDNGTAGGVGATTGYIMVRAKRGW